MCEGDIVLLPNVDRQPRNAHSLTATRITPSRLFTNETSTEPSCRKYSVELRYITDAHKHAADDLVNI